MTRIRCKQTEMDRGMQAEREREGRDERGVVFFSHLKAFVIIGPMLVIEKCIWSADSQGKYVSLCAAHPISLRYPSFIEVFQPSLSHLVWKYSIARSPFSFLRPYPLLSLFSIVLCLSLLCIFFYCSFDKPYSPLTLPLFSLSASLCAPSSLLPHYIPSLSLLPLVTLITTC